jgi:hypothetical protein
MSKASYPLFPIYVPSKGRHEYLKRNVRNTSRALTDMGVKHYLVVEPQEIDAYRDAVKSSGLLAEVLELDLDYKKRYALCDDLGLTKSTGSGPARNFIWDHSVAAGHERHWIMDDNIRIFCRYNENFKTPINSPAFFRAQEDFCSRYTNVAMAGPQYYMFVSRKSKIAPFAVNTRIYSCNLIRNDIPFRWRGRYNEDTILSLDILKAGWCTIQFNTFLQEKAPTQSWKGGNTEELYHRDGIATPGENYAFNGTLAKSQMLVRLHPDVARLVWKFNRWHHQVDYTPFRANKLIRKPGVKLADGANNYGMKLVKIVNNHPIPFSRKAAE